MASRSADAELREESYPMATRLRRALATGAGVLALTSPAAATDWSLGLGSGVVKANDFPNQTVYWTAIAQARPSGAPLAFEVEVGFWSKSVESSTTNAEGYFYDRMARSDLHLGFNMFAETPGDHFRALFGVGLGPHAVKNDSTQTTNYAHWPEMNSSYTFSYSHTKLGLHGLGGFDAVLSERLSLFAMVRYDLLKGEAQNEIKYYGGLRVTVVKARSSPPP